jgi:5-methyltetrahydropteroyltriglutamate--homocysteine methyltransferase
VFVIQVPEVQVLEPALVMHDASKDRASYEGAYKAFSGCVPINLVTFYDDLGECYEWAVALPVQAISIDFVGTVRACHCLCRV